MPPLSKGLHWALTIALESALYCVLLLTTSMCLLCLVTQGHVYAHAHVPRPCACVVCLSGVPEVHSEHDEANADSASSDEGESSDASHSANHNAAQSTSDTGTSSTSGDDDIQAVNDGEGPEVGTVVRRTRQGTRAHADQANQATNAGGARPSGRSAAERAADAAAAPLRTPQRLRPNATPSNAGAGGNEPATGVEVVALEDSD